LTTAIALFAMHGTVVFLFARILVFPAPKPPLLLISAMAWVGYWFLVSLATQSRDHRGPDQAHLALADPTIGH